MSKAVSSIGPFLVVRIEAKKGGSHGGFGRVVVRRRGFIDMSIRMEPDEVEALRPYLVTDDEATTALHHHGGTSETDAKQLFLTLTALKPPEELPVTPKPPEGLVPASEPSEGLVGFLYTLMRDDVVAGRVEKLVMNGESHPPPYEFSNPHIEAYARELAARLLGQT